MRYLFRGKSLKNGEWMDGYYLPLESPSNEGIEKLAEYIAAQIMTSNGKYTHMTEICANTLCQCTGVQALKPLKEIVTAQGIRFIDQNAKREKQWLYEGDIIRYCSHNRWLYVVEWDTANARWCFNNSRYKLSFYELDLNRCEIIGNKFDNPELIKRMEGYNGVQPTN